RLRRVARLPLLELQSGEDLHGRRGSDVPGFHVGYLGRQTSPEWDITVRGLDDSGPGARRSYLRYNPGLDFSTAPRPDSIHLGGQRPYGPPPGEHRPWAGRRCAGAVRRGRILRYDGAAPRSRSARDG